MTNEEKYRAQEERGAAFAKLCTFPNCGKCKYITHLPRGRYVNTLECLLRWLSDEYKEPGPDLPFEVQGSAIVRTDTQIAVVVRGANFLAGLEKQCALMNEAALEWHKQKLAHECASTEQEEDE